MLLGVFEVAGANIERHSGAHLARQIEAVWIHIGDDDKTRARVPRDRDGHDADGTCAGDEDVLTQHRKRQRGVHRVPERIENGSDLAIDAGALVP